MTAKLIKRACRGIKRMSWGVVRCIDETRCKQQGCPWVVFHQLPADSPLRRKKLEHLVGGRW